MRMIVVAALIGVMSAGPVSAQDIPQMPQPVKQHEWLAQLAGEWETEGKMLMCPDQPAITCKGTETVTTLGGFWIVSEMKSEFMGQPMIGRMTVGYDAAAKKYVGTWVCSCDGHLWKYEGTLDETSNTLTLESEGPDMTKPGKMAKYRDVMTLKDKDTRVLTSSVQTEDGKWVQFMTMTAKRKK